MDGVPGLVPALLIAGAIFFVICLLLGVFDRP